MDKTTYENLSTQERYSLPASVLLRIGFAKLEREQKEKGKETSKYAEGTIKQKMSKAYDKEGEDVEK